MGSIFARRAVTGLQSDSRPRGSLLVEFGVSLVAQGYYPGYSGATPPAIRAYLAEGPMHWVRRRLRNGFIVPAAFGVGGTTTAQALGRLKEVLSLDPLPDWCVIWIGSDVQNSVTAFADVATVVAGWIANITAITQTLRDAGIRPMLITLPPHGSWVRVSAQQYAQALCRQWVHDYAKKHQIIFINGFQPFARPERQPTKACTGLSRTANVVTATVTAHGYSTGDWVVQVDAVDAAFDISGISPNPTVQITNTGANTFTYAHTGANGTSTVHGSFIRNDLIPDLSSDGWAHLNAKGASKFSLLIKPIFEKLFPPVDDLSDSEADLLNFAGSGVAATTDVVISRGMMTGTTGTRSGTAVSHTGNVAAGLISNVVSGNPTSVVCAKVTRTEKGYEHQEWQEVAITAAGGADCVHELGILQTLPSAWAANTVKALGNFVKPVAPNGFFYVCVGNGTTHATTEPVWPTRPGERVTDGSVTWECRLGWRGGSKVVAMAEYKIQAMSAADAIQSLSFGLTDPNDSTRSILDFQLNQEANAPLYQVDENGYFCTPEALVDPASTQFILGMRVRVTAGKSATLRLARLTARNLSLA